MSHPYIEILEALFRDDRTEAEKRRDRIRSRISGCAFIVVLLFLSFACAVGILEIYSWISLEFPRVHVTIE